jgi:NADPH-ferrihemoprotein reductase
MSSILMLASAGQPWNIPLSFVMESLGLIQSGYYSIASASAVYPRQISLAVVLLSIHLDESDDIIHSVTSTYISKLCENKTSSGEVASQGQVAGEELAELFYHVRKSTFKLPASEAQPMLMIATGTGVAPCRGFIQHRVRLYQIDREVGRTILIFGCRDENSHLYMG